MIGEFFLMHFDHRQRDAHPFAEGGGATSRSAPAAEAVLHGKWDTQQHGRLNDGGWFTGQVRPELLQAHVFSGFHYQSV